MRLGRDLSRCTALLSRVPKERLWAILSCAGGGLLLFTWLAHAPGAEERRIIFKREGIPDFKNASILGNPGQAVLSGEERLFTKQQKAITETQNQLKAEIERLRAEVQAVRAQPSTTPIAGLGFQQPSPIYGPPEPSPSPSPIVQLGPPAEEYTHTRLNDRVKTSQAAPRAPEAPNRTSRFASDTLFPPPKGARHGRSGASMISFPVKSTGAVYLKKPSVVLPSGSYVKAKLLTGVEAPEGKTYPVLLQLDFAFIIPNQKRLDLAGCFVIAKAQGDLSTERVQMQATKLSCVSKHGGMFEREINGFIADDADNSFAVMGSVNSKQDRVASTAFLASIVSGIGKAIQQAQTTQQATPLGGGQTILTGDQAKYIGAGGASEAATMVTQWYLKQAQNLLPTINVGSGQDVWVILQDQVDLPKDYFTQNSTGGLNDVSIYSYFTRLVD